MNNRYYRLTLDDYSAASFTSFSKDYYGTLEQITELIEALRDNKDRQDTYQALKEPFDKFMSGDKYVMHNVAYRDVRFLSPVKVLGMANSKLTNATWEHINTWGYPYNFKCDYAKCEHIWISGFGKYCRVVKVHFTNLQMENTLGEYRKAGCMLWGFPGQITGENGNLHNRLLVEEKVFKNRMEALEDYLAFQENKNTNFKEFVNDIVGDG